MHFKVTEKKGFFPRNDEGFAILTFHLNNDVASYKMSLNGTPADPAGMAATKCRICQYYHRPSTSP